MSAFASLASGDSCGPTNPMAQLSKLYSSDRGVQQDHFSSQAGPSSSNFRQSNQQTNQLNQSANNFFNPHKHQHQPQQPLDLIPLAHSLPHSHNATPPPLAAPAWAQAFAKSDLQHGTHHHLQHDSSFNRAFSPAPVLAGNPAWVSDFGRQGTLTGSSKAMTVEPTQAQAQAEARMMAGGVGGVGRMGMMGMQRPMGGMGVSMGGQAFSPVAAVATNQISHLHPDQVTHTKQDWASAFSAQDITAVDSSRQAYSSDQLTRPDSPIQRAESPRTATRARDQLAETAGALLSSVQRGESQAQTTAGDKMAQSTFLELMRKLRDGEVEVQGDKVVEQSEPVGADAKGKGRAHDPEPFYQQERRTDGASAAPFTSASLQAAHTGSAVEEFARVQHQFAVDQSVAAQAARDHAAGGYQPQDTTDLWADEDSARQSREDYSRPQQARHVQFQGDGGTLQESDGEMDERTEAIMRFDSRVAGATSGWEEDFDAEMIAGGHARPQPQGPRELSAQQKEWEALQNDWENFEATATGIQPVASTSSQFSQASIIGGYRFAGQNPYVETTRTHAQHASSSSMHPSLSTYDSVLQTEAAVQQNPKSAPAWLALGIKQQENEREDLAILALQQAVALDSSLGEAHLALAISFTNENQRGLAYECMEKWVDGLERTYPGVVEGFKERWGGLSEGGGLEGRHRALTEVLMELARLGGADVDAEVQVGLGVLFNSSDEYEKAGDCFAAALEVRPDDPLLYNRLGATYANSGKTELAIQYYLEACALRPGYVRARFNLAVANMNLSHYQEAIAHLITALDIQQEEAKREETGANGAPAAATLTSQTLWDSLNTCLMMLQRSDLSALTVQRDLGGLKQAFGDELSF